LNLTPVQVKQIKEEALKKLGQPVKSHHLLSIFSKNGGFTKLIEKYNQLSQLSK
jgi:hypothetical protein